MIPWTTVYLAGIVAVALLRLGELWLARSHLLSLGDQAKVVEEPLFTAMVVLHVSFFVVIPLELWVGGASIGGAVSLISLIMLLLALCLRFWTLKTLGASWHVRVVIGGPIVSHGPYRFIKHPNYLVVILEMLSIPLIHHLYVSAVVLSLGNAWVLSRRMKNEEQALSQNPEWVKSMSHKPRLIPRWPHD